jgi:cyanophycin synthetase
VLEVARGGLLRAGMGVPWVNVGAVLNVQSDHLGMKGIDTLEELAEVKRILVEVASDCAVLNADDRTRASACRRTPRRSTSAT